MGQHVLLLDMKFCFHDSNYWVYSHLGYVMLSGVLMLN